jgi:pimeloyl-ACP methyl ester carboxylesterase
VTAGPDSRTETGIAWRRLGSGPPIVLINGYAATKDDWDPVLLDTLGASSTVFCPDNRGVGDSEPAEGELTFAQMAADVVAVMDAEGLETATVAGWSMGGMIAQEVAASHPGRVDALVLLATDPGGPLARQCSRDVGERLYDHSGTPHEQARRLLDLLFPPRLADGLYRQFGDVVAEARAKLSGDALTCQEQALGERYAASADERLAAIRAPALIATGAEDIVIPPENSAILAERLENSWLARFPACGHAFQAQEPQRLAALIGAFLDRPA